MVVTTEFDRICSGYVHETRRLVQLADEIAGQVDQVLLAEALHLAGLLCSGCAHALPRRLVGGVMTHVHPNHGRAECRAGAIHQAIAAGRYKPPSAGRVGGRLQTPQQDNDAQLSLGRGFDHG